jgi:hypothetical protein
MIVKHIVEVHATMELHGTEFFLHTHITWKDKYIFIYFPVITQGTVLYYNVTRTAVPIEL